jgi:hypothetical protein
MMQKKGEETLLAKFFFEALFHCAESCAGCARPYWRGHRDGEHHATDWPGPTQVPLEYLTVPEAVVSVPEFILRSYRPAWAMQPVGPVRAYPAKLLAG